MVGFVYCKDVNCCQHHISIVVVVVVAASVVIVVVVAAAAAAVVVVAGIAGVVVVGKRWIQYLLCRALCPSVLDPTLFCLFLLMCFFRWIWFPNCLRFANPAEATRDWKLGDLEARKLGNDDMLICETFRSFLVAS